MKSENFNFKFEAVKKVMIKLFLRWFTSLIYIEVLVFFGCFTSNFLPTIKLKYRTLKCVWKSWFLKHYLIVNTSKIVIFRIKKSGWSIFAKSFAIFRNWQNWKRYANLDMLYFLKIIKIINLYSFSNRYLTLLLIEDER